MLVVGQMRSWEITKAQRSALSLYFGCFLAKTFKFGVIFVGVYRCSQHVCSIDLSWKPARSYELST